ncbi:redoxin domain-containing protein [Sphingobacteriales bacterium CHB3]|nr:redoxin domain-containing protein [Sphingobacteriales bacterium CHB3]
MTATEIQPQTTRAHEVFGDFWFNSEPVIISALRGRVVLIQFWDYTCGSCLRALPYVNEWYKRYREHGLVVIGVHTPKFPFGKNPEYVQKAIERSGISYPVVMDNEAVIAARYDNRDWPTTYLIDKHGFIRYKSTGEGQYATTERVLQTLLYDAGVFDEMPMLMDPLREEDRAGSVLYRSTPELFAGYLKGSIGNVEGYAPESAVNYDDPDFYLGDRIYAVGVWMNDRNSLRHYEHETGKIILRYHALGVNVVAKPEGDSTIEVVVTQDGEFLTGENRGNDIEIDTEGKSVIAITEPRMYNLVKNPAYGEHVLRLVTESDAFSLYSFTFVSSVIPELISNN